MLLIPLFFGLAALAAGQSDHDVKLYEDAITTLQRQHDPSDLQRFVSTAPFGRLKDDGLQWLIWQYRSAHDGRARQWAQQLLKTQPDNAVALATISENTQEITPQLRALDKLKDLRPPQGMLASTFEPLKADLAQDLNAAVGYAYYLQNDLASARTFLQKGVSPSSANPQYTYALAIADLYAANPDETEGFQMLARTVNLTRGTAQGAQLAAFARDKFTKRGGSVATWEQYLQNTSSGIVLAKTENSAAPVRAAVPAESTSAAVASSSQPRSAVAQPRPTENAAVLETKPPGFPVHTERLAEPPQAPFSLGILVETSKASHGSRRAVVNSLTDMVRHLRENDEAFVVSFSKDVVFEQDLTGNPDALESAIDSIRPNRGTALLDAVAFAAGHLSRIAKNQNKVLLVISDGENEKQQTPPLEVSGELNASKVKIYCIGMGAQSYDDQYRLQALARNTGGQAMFIDGTGQFRNATQQVAANLGVAFR